MAITFKRATKHHSKVFRTLAADALKARLYVPGWMLFDDLDSLVNYEEHRPIIIGDSIVVAYNNDNPVGVCIISCKNGRVPESMTFVRKRLRRSGIGTKLLKKALGKRIRFRYGDGTRSTKGFFKQFKGAQYDESF